MKSLWLVEKYFGIVKAVGSFPKNPSQHCADLEMLEEILEVKPMFFVFELMVLQTKGQYMKKYNLYGQRKNLQLHVLLHHKIVDQAT